MKVEERKNVRRKEKRKKRLRSSPSLRSRFGLLSNLGQWIPKNEQRERKYKGRNGKRNESLSKEMKKERKEGGRAGKEACLPVLLEFSHWCSDWLSHRLTTGQLIKTKRNAWLIDRFSWLSHPLTERLSYWLNGWPLSSRLAFGNQWLATGHLSSWKCTILLAGCIQEQLSAWWNNWLAGWDSEWWASCLVS